MDDDRYLPALQISSSMVVVNILITQPYFPPGSVDRAPEAEVHPNHSQCFGSGRQAL